MKNPEPNDIKYHSASIFIAHKLLYNFHPAPKQHLKLHENYTFKKKINIRVDKLT